MTYPPVIVIWRDITTLNGWISQEELDTYVVDEEENIVFQAGFLYEEDENQIILLNSIFKSKDIMGDATKIPKDTVIEIQRLVDIKMIKP